MCVCVCVCVCVCERAPVCVCVSVRQCVRARARPIYSQIIRLCKACLAPFIYFTERDNSRWLYYGVSVPTDTGCITVFLFPQTLAVLRCCYSHRRKLFTAVRHSLYPAACSAFGTILWNAAQHEANSCVTHSHYTCKFISSFSPAHSDQGLRFTE